MLTFTKIKNSFFQGAIFINYFWIFKWIARELLLHSVPGVGVQINTLKTQEVQITLIQCCFKNTTLPPVFSG